MKILHISPTEPGFEAVKAAAEYIANGGVVVFPSDSCYGLAADPRNSAAMEKLYLIKNRPAEKAVSCIFRSIDTIAEWAELSPAIITLLEMHLPGPFTFLLEPKLAYPLFSEDALVGARIPDHPFTQALSEAVGPYTATSANRSGEPSTYSIDELQSQLAGGELPDLLLDAGVLPAVAPSTVVDLTVSPPTIVRQGSGLFKEIH
jgi:L-threonylcarbamoyladenylate synthase